MGRKITIDIGTVISVALGAFLVFGLAGCAEAFASTVGLVTGPESGEPTLSWRLGDVTIPLTALVAIVKWKPTVVVEHTVSPETIASWDAIAKIAGRAGK